MVRLPAATTALVSLSMAPSWPNPACLFVGDQTALSCKNGTDAGLSEHAWAQRNASLVDRARC